MMGFSRTYDVDGTLIAVMCPICFVSNAPVAARDGGKLSTEKGDTYDVCVSCSTNEYLIFAAMMGA